MQSSRKSHQHAGPERPYLHREKPVALLVLNVKDKQFKYVFWEKTTIMQQQECEEAGDGVVGIPSV